MFPVFYAGHRKDFQNQTRSSQAVFSLGYILFSPLIALCATLQPKTDLFSYWPQFAATITVTERILGSVGRRQREQPSSSRAYRPWNRVGTCWWVSQQEPPTTARCRFDSRVRVRGREETDISFQAFHLAHCWPILGSRDHWGFCLLCFWL